MAAPSLERRKEWGLLFIRFIHLSLRKCASSWGEKKASAAPSRRNLITGAVFKSSAHMQMRRRRVFQTNWSRRTKRVAVIKSRRDIYMADVHHVIHSASNVNGPIGLTLKNALLTFHLLVAVHRSSWPCIAALGPLPTGSTHWLPTPKKTRTKISKDTRQSQYPCAENKTFLRQFFSAAKIKEKKSLNNSRRPSTTTSTGGGYYKRIKKKIKL